MLNEEIKAKMPFIVQLLELHKVKSAWVFGSATTKNFSEKSDLDILVTLHDGIEPAEAGEHLWNLQDSLIELLNRQVDLLTYRSLKNPWFIKEINNTKEQIYG